MAQQREAGRTQASALSAAWVSDVGCVREVNEDRCAALPERGLFVVSDGMGGEVAGAAAARLVVGWTPELLSERLPNGDDVSSHQVELALGDVALELNHRVRQESSRTAGGRKMGATMAVAAAVGDRVVIGHVGDSRIYLFSSGTLECLTQDHSVVGILVQRGAISAEQAQTHPMRGRLSRYIGMGGNATADLRTVDWRPSDRLLLCSDGLTNFVQEDQIQQVLREEDDLLAACHHLADAAREVGGQDNITVLVVEKTA